MASTGSGQIQGDQVGQLREAFGVVHVAGECEVGQVGHAGRLVEVEVGRPALVALAVAKSQPLQIGQLPHVVCVPWQPHVPAPGHGQMPQQRQGLMQAVLMSAAAHGIAVDPMRRHSHVSKE